MIAPRFLRINLFLSAMVVGLGAFSVQARQQVVDPDFKPVVARPAYHGNGPTVAIDEAHVNFHTAGGRYKPFTDLLTKDGYRIISSKKTFQKGTFDSVDILVIANAFSGILANPSFTEEECDVVSDWVREGGSLLLIADHAPFGSAAANLGQRFGVEMGKGWAYDVRPLGGGITTQLIFSRENGLLADHPIVHGRDTSEAVKLVRSFTGQSLSIPENATALLKFSPTAREVPDAKDLNVSDSLARVDSNSLSTTDVNSVSVNGRAQGLAFKFGKGKVVMLGEAAMFSAQVVTLTVGGTKRTIKAGMNVPGHDDQQFALNVLHWLSGVLSLKTGPNLPETPTVP